MGKDCTKEKCGSLSAMSWTTTLTMRSQLPFAIPVTLLAAALIVPSSWAQARGTHQPYASAPPAQNSFQHGEGRGAEREGHHRFFNRGGFFYPAYFYYDDGFDGQPDQPVRPHFQPVAQTAAEAPLPPAKPVEAMLLEKRNGEWVRIPTGSQTAVASTSKPASTHTSGTRSGIIEPAATAAPAAKLPPAAVVFRDGHSEELGKYMIQGDFLYMNPDHSNTGSWTRKIRLADLDLPASLKLNQTRGTKFNLPSGPNEVVIRF
jgi:hypothetical protein